MPPSRRPRRSATVMVEKYLPGDDFRLLVIGEKLVAAARRDPPHVIGDGVHTRARAGRARQRRPAPRRRPRHLADARSASTTSPSRGCRRRAWRPTRCPPRAARVLLRNNANLSTGGTATDVTDDVHPEVAARAVAAAQMVGPAHLRRRRGLRKRAAPARRAARRHRRGQCRARAAHAPVAVLRQGPRRRRGDRRPPVRARRRRPHPGGGRHRHQRQDHHRRG